MYIKGYGIIETLGQLHVGATAGEETGNLNLIFRDQFTQTGIIPGSSIRGRMKSEMRLTQGNAEASYWYGQESDEGETTESRIKFEYASLLWLPVFCPGQPIVWVTCPSLLKRYKRIASAAMKGKEIPEKYTGSQKLDALEIDGKHQLFFNFGFLTIEHPRQNLSDWFPLGRELPAVVVADNEIAMIHDMALYRQSRVALEKEQKRAKGKAFFNTEALPEGTQLVFPIAIRRNEPNDDKKKNEPNDNHDRKWRPFGESDGGESDSGEIYLGGLESIGFGHCQIKLVGFSEVLADQKSTDKR